MLPAERSDICGVADLIEQVDGASDLGILLLNGLDWYLGIADRATGRAADGGGDLWRREHVPCDLNGFAEILLRVLERQRGEHTDVIRGDQPHCHIRLDRDGKRVTRCATRYIGTLSHKRFHEKART